MVSCTQIAHVAMLLIIHMALYLLFYIHIHVHLGNLLLWNAHKFEVLKLDSGMKLVLLSYPWHVAILAHIVLIILSLYRIS